VELRYRHPSALEQIMKPKGPALILVCGLVLAGVLVGLNIAADRTASATNASATNANANVARAATASASESASSSATPSDAAGSPSPTPPAPPSPPITYAGRVNGGEAAIAIAVRDGQAIAYLCNGKKLESWLKGPAGDGQLALTGANGASLTGTHNATIAAGSVTVDGRTWTFRIPAVQAPNGLYRIANKVAEASVSGGWVVYKNGQTGNLTVNGVSGAAPWLNPATGEVTINGVTVKPPRL
jgi:hypothetical protein